MQSQLEPNYFRDLRLDNMVTLVKVDKLVELLRKYGYPEAEI